MFRRVIGEYHFVADAKTGMTMRWGRTLRDNPAFAPVPELADISISNHCTKGCSYCYRNSSTNEQFMSIENYVRVLESMNHPRYGNVFQVAIGGGEPLEHPDFIQIIEETGKRGIVPNFTTNGIHLSSKVCKAIKSKVGAVAISASSVDEIPLEKISLLRAEAIKVNVHYVLSSDNIKEATAIVQGEYTGRLKGVNAIVFLTYKPAGRASDKFVVKDGEELEEFMKAVNDRNENAIKIGFDACFVPMLMHYTNIKSELVDTCEGGFFSLYIDHEMNVSPCSFSGERDRYSLNEYDFYDIWLNKFEKYRQEHTNKCIETDCKAYSQCRGCCPYYPKITTCYAC